jgi:putative transposase
MGYNYYDHRLRNYVAETGDVESVRDLVPMSTLRDWIKKGPKEDVISLPQFEYTNSKLVSENLDLKSRLERLTAEKEVVFKSVRIFGFQIQYMRLPSADAKADLIEAITNAAKVISLKVCLNLIGLSPQRFHAWTRKAKKCLLQDQSSCPRNTPSKILSDEVTKIVEHLKSDKFAHYSMTQLMLYAKRHKIVSASLSSWSRIASQFGLKRSRERVYPTKPRIGIRASSPGEIWHLDVSKIKLLDGTRAYIQAITDNYSRYVLAWKASLEYGGNMTKELIQTALNKSHELGVKTIPNVVVDGGKENHNSMVDALIKSGLIFMTEAIDFSNSMIEMVFHRLKNRHLYFVELTSLEVLIEQTDFYLNESNVIMPHSALGGGTPFEVFTAIWDGADIDQLKSNSQTAVAERIATNRALTCAIC